MHNINDKKVKVLFNAHLNHPLQHIFASLFLVAEVSFLLRHEDAVATVKLNVCPPANVANVVTTINKDNML